MYIRALVMTVMVAFAIPSALAETIAKTYPVKDFTEFVSGGNTQVEISQDGTEYLRVEADAEVMKRVKVDQSGKRVSVWVKSDGNFFNWFGHSNDPVRIVLRVKELEYLEISGGAQATLGEFQGDKFQVNVSGAGDVKFSSLNAKNLRMDLSGAANVRIKSVNSQTQDFDLSGASDLEVQSTSSTQELDVVASGASNFRAKKLTAKRAHLEASGASHVEAAVTETLDANASGASSVDYYGKPKVKSDSSGASNVSAKDE
ncbi:MAG TPA: head GIN domain-containing protein [Cellvibrio sp.]|nr:head GIN domain-containing protein [Cellvibrio sp.]